MVYIMTPDELGQHVTDTRESGISIKRGGKWHKALKKYAFFHLDSPADADIFVHGYHIPVEYENYGFPNSRTVGIDTRGRITGFSEKPQQTYDSLFLTGRVPLNEALETIAAAVNESTVYDVEAVLTGDFNEEFKRNVKELNYVPNGDEVTSGICSDTGNVIRTLLGNTLRDPSLRYTHIGARGEVSAHDTTFLLDIETGEWVVVNSKSPFKPYNVVPREKLPELGDPYI